MRVAIVAEVYLPKIDGVVIRTMNLIRELREAGDDVIVICPQADGACDSPVPVVEFPSFPFPMYPEYRIGQPDDRLVEVIKTFQPDVIHFLNPFAFGFRCHDWLSDSGLRIPTVFSFHTLYPEFVKRYGLLKPLSKLLWRLSRHYHNCADLNLTVSDVTRLDLTDRGFDRVRLWQPAVDSELFHPSRRCSEMQSRLAGEHDCRYQLLTVSRLAPEKNVELLSEVLRHLPDASLAIVGDGPHRQALKRHFSGLPVTFFGYLEGKQLAQAYASADAFVYASETETMGNVVLESMASGTPVVAARSGGILSLTTHEHNGLLFVPGDAATAAAHVRDILIDDAQRLNIAVNARDFAERHGWTEAAARVRSDYTAAIERQNHRDGEERVGRLLSGSWKARLTARTLVTAFRGASFFVRTAVPMAPNEGHATVATAAPAMFRSIQTPLAETVQHSDEDPILSGNNHLEEILMRARPSTQSRSNARKRSVVAPKRRVHGARK